MTFDNCLFQWGNRHYVRNLPAKYAADSYKMQQFFQLLKKTYRRYLRLAVISRKLFWDSEIWCIAACLHSKPLAREIFKFCWVSPRWALNIMAMKCFEHLWTVRNNFGLGLLGYPICLAKLSFSSRQITSGNGFCRFFSHSTSSQWWECGSFRKKQWGTMQHSTFRWRSVIHPNFCKLFSHSTSSQWWECGSLRSKLS